MEKQVERRRSARASTSAASSSSPHPAASVDASVTYRAIASRPIRDLTINISADAESSGSASALRSNPRRAGRLPEGLYNVSNRGGFDAFLQTQQRAADQASLSASPKVFGQQSEGSDRRNAHKRRTRTTGDMSSSPRPKRRRLERGPGLPTPSPSVSPHALDLIDPDVGNDPANRPPSIHTVSSDDDEEYENEGDDADRDAYTDDSLAAGEYVVERLIARSREQARPAQATAAGKRKRTGKLEWWYLVRWAGYGPSDDTWEPQSVLMRGAKKAVKQFDAKPHPFQIVGRRGEDEKKMQYLVVYGESGPSPLREQVWQARSLIGKDHQLQQNVVDAALRDYDRTCSGARTCDWVKQGKGCRTMMKILDSDLYSPKSNSKGKGYVYLVKAWNHQEGREEEVWWTQQRLKTIFGPEDATDCLARYKAKRDRRLAAEAQDAVEATTATEYEQERQRNIRENAALLASLSKMPRRYIQNASRAVLPVAHTTEIWEHCWPPIDCNSLCEIRYT